MGIKCYEEGKNNKKVKKNYVNKCQDGGEDYKNNNKSEFLLNGGSQNKNEKKPTKNKITETYENQKEEKNYIKNSNSQREKKKDITHAGNQRENKIDLNYIYNNILNEHNSIRKQYKCDKLNLNPILNKLAQKYADNFNIINDSNYSNENYNNQPLGINYEIFKGDITKISEIYKKWINEKEYYNQNNSNNINYCSKTKHFTQIIWKKTKEIGFGYSQINTKEKIFVAYYYPAGNIFNEFKENISIKKIDMNI